MSQSTAEQQIRIVTTGRSTASDSVNIFAVGARPLSAAPGSTIAQTLQAAGMVVPGAQQTVRVNGEEIRDLRQVLQAGDQVQIVNRVSAGRA